MAEPEGECVVVCGGCGLSVSSPGTSRPREYFERFANHHAHKCRGFGKGESETQAVELRVVPNPEEGKPLAECGGEVVGRYSGGNVPEVGNDV